jgi:hypothetical protein
MRTIAIAALAALAGCGGSSGVTPLGGGQFLVTVETNYLTGGMAAAQAQAAQEAAAACGARQVVPSAAIPTLDQRNGYYAFSLRFSCA